MGKGGWSRDLAAGCFLCALCGFLAVLAVFAVKSLYRRARKEIPQGREESHFHTDLYSEIYPFAPDAIFCAFTRMKA
jgi:hypothetical protein